MEIELLRKEADLWKIVDGLTTWYIAVNHRNGAINGLLIIQDGLAIPLFKRHIKAIKKVMEAGEYRVE